MKSRRPRRPRKPKALKKQVEAEQEKPTFEKEANECWKKVFDKDQVAITELRSKAEELSRTVAGCRDLSLHAKANVKKLGSLQEKLPALTAEVGKLKETVQQANLARRKSQIG